MNYTVVDITDIPECTLNDIAIFIGKSETKSLSLYDWTDQTGISPTHLTTNFKSTVTRICVLTLFEINDSVYTDRCKKSSKQIIIQDQKHVHN